uniref:hypothetical protein n=1 Tax=uncultured Erythrobacter sp. TaxID=263913 RepID=UPI0026163F1F|nr:hypothetical protein [uncultured Erythrobacter sp.]
MRSLVMIGGLFALALSGCAGSAFDAERTVFNNPYTALETDNGPVGPACDEAEIRNPKCRNDDRPYPVSEYERDADGNLVRLTRAERQFFRERREALESKQDVLDSLENGTPIPSNSPALPKPSTN